jgi:hypothetical protein
MPKKLYRAGGITTGQLAAFFAKFPEGTKILVPGYPGYTSRASWTTLSSVEEITGKFITDTVVGPFGSVGKDRFFTNDGDDVFVSIGSLR